MSNKLKVYAMIKSLRTKTTKWANEVQVVLVECIRIAIQCDSNIDPCKRVLEALEGGADVKAAAKYLCAHAPVQVIKGELVFNKSFTGEFDAEYLNANPWTRKTMTASKALEELDVLESFQSFITRMSREVKLGLRTVKHAEALKELSALSGKLVQQSMTEEEVANAKKERELVTVERADQAATDAAQKAANIARLKDVNLSR